MSITTSSEDLAAIVIAYSPSISLDAFSTNLSYLETTDHLPVIGIIYPDSWKELSLSVAKESAVSIILTQLNHGLVLAPVEGDAVFRRTGLIYMSRSKENVWSINRRPGAHNLFSNVVNIAISERGRR